MFSAVWSIANQAAAEAGFGPLGHAAPILYELSSNAITDVNLKAADTKNNVTGSILNPPNPPQTVSAVALAGPEASTTRFVSALFQSSATN